MPNYHEAYLGISWLYATLSGDATLTSLAPGGIWRGLADPGTPTPFVVIGLQSGSDSTTMNGFRMLDDLLYLVKVSGPTNNDAGIHSASAQVDALLGGTTTGPASGPVVINTITVGQVLSCYRQSPIFLDELVSGETWSNLGGLYRMEIQQIAT